MALSCTGKTITDPLYGNIQLTDVESKLISTKAFQRLHNVRQLGLGHIVFPNAGYSRFSHSVGACFNADRMLSAIETNAPSKTFSDAERQAFRIAALFHDLGHYPFSHTTEHASKRFYRGGIFKEAQDDRQGVLGCVVDVEKQPVFIDHEDAGKLILEHDQEIAGILDGQSLVSRADITNVFINEGLSTIISSDLDCDRLDYLKRTSLHSGAPYGAVDVEFIISKSTVDGDGRFCFDRKAARATDHLLVSRFYDFMQIPYHKTVAALEWSLEESVIHLLKQSKLGLSQADVQTMLDKGTWNSFDDANMLGLMRKAVTARATDELSRDHLSAVLHRKPARQVYSWEMLDDKGDGEISAKEQLLGYKIAEAAKTLGLDERRFKIWKAPFRLSKAGPILQGSPQDREYSDEEDQQLILVLEKGATSARPLIDLPNAVSHHLAKLRYKVLRVYYLKSDDDPLDIQQRLWAMLTD